MLLHFIYYIIDTYKDIYIRKNNKIHADNEPQTDTYKDSKFIKKNI